MSGAWTDADGRRNHVEDAAADEEPRRSGVEPAPPDVPPRRGDELLLGVGEVAGEKRMRWNDSACGIGSVLRAVILGEVWRETDDETESLAEGRPATPTEARWAWPWTTVPAKVPTSILLSRGCLTVLEPESKDERESEARRVGWGGRGRGERGGERVGRGSPGGRRRVARVSDRAGVRCVRQEGRARRRGAIERRELVSAEIGRIRRLSAGLRLELDSRAAPSSPLPPSPHALSSYLLATMAPAALAKQSLKRKRQQQDDAAAAPSTADLTTTTTTTAAAPKPYKQRVLVTSSRGISQRQRHLMTDLLSIMPHAKKGPSSSRSRSPSPHQLVHVLTPDSHPRTETKLEDKHNLPSLNELCYLSSCNNALFFEARRQHNDLYLWAAKAPNGPSVRFHVLNLHTMDEMKMTGNCLKGSRPVVVFDKQFDDEPHLQLIKEVLTHVRLLSLSFFARPKTPPADALDPPRRRSRSPRRRAGPSPSSTMSSTSASSTARSGSATTRFVSPSPRTAFLVAVVLTLQRRSQILDTPSADALAQTTSSTQALTDAQARKVAQKEGMPHLSLSEVGPRFVLNPVKIFEGSFNGACLYENKGASLVPFASPSHNAQPAACRAAGRAALAVVVRASDLAADPLSRTHRPQSSSPRRSASRAPSSHAPSSTAAARTPRPCARSASTR